jgi:hypothetical protein
MSRSNTMTAPMPLAKTEASESSWRNVAVLVLCGAVLAAGFFFAARQHFSSMELGIKNSQLRKQLSDLEAENRRLSLAKEVALSPTAIQKASRLIAGPKAEATSAELAMVKTLPPVTPVKPQPADTEVKAQLTRTDAAKANIADKVVKTALVKPAGKPQGAKQVKSANEPKAKQKA